MSKKDKKIFSDPRWNQPIGGNVIGQIEKTKEEKEKTKTKFQDHLKKIGILKED